MLTVRTLAIVTMGAAVFAAVPSAHAQICDNDRFPCPVRFQARQQNADAHIARSRSAKPHKKVDQAAAEKKENQAAAAHAKNTPEASVPMGQAETPAAEPIAETNQATALVPAADPVATTAPVVSQSVIPQNEAQAAGSIASASAEEPSPADHLSEAMTAVAGEVWPVSRDSDATSPAATPDPEPAQASPANAVKVADVSGSNGPFGFASSRRAEPARSWIVSLLLIVGVGLAAVSVMAFSPRVRSRFLGRAA
jgi:hypothetical protein